MDYAKEFAQYEAFTQKHGDKTLKSAAADFRTELDRYHANIANQKRLEKELEELPEKAAALAAEGKPTDDIVEDLGGLRDELEIASAVVSGSATRIAKSWESFLEKYHAWEQAEVRVFDEAAIDLARRELIPIAKELSKALRKFEDLEVKAGIITEGNDLAQTPDLVGLITFTRFLSKAMNVRLGIEPGEPIIMNTGRESLREWRRMRGVYDRVVERGKLESCDAAMVIGFADYFSLPLDSRQPIK